MITAWRIVKAAHVKNAFDGEGARLTGGRWNSPGIPMVYTADSAALAALEMLVHLQRGAQLLSYVVMSCAFDESLVLRLDRERLPANWRSYPAPAALQMLGDAWQKSGASLVLDVPSAIIVTASTFLINPRHQSFPRISIGGPEPFELDWRRQ